VSVLPQASAAAKIGHVEEAVKLLKMSDAPIRAVVGYLMGSPHLLWFTRVHAQANLWDMDYMTICGQYH
jgi:hypothetical protein